MNISRREQKFSKARFSIHGKKFFIMIHLMSSSRKSLQEKVSFVLSLEKRDIKIMKL